MVNPPELTAPGWSPISLGEVLGTGEGLRGDAQGASKQQPDWRPNRVDARQPRREARPLQPALQALILHGKEGVDGSSPSEGSRRKPCKTRGFRSSALLHFVERTRVWNRFWNTQTKKVRFCRLFRQQPRAGSGGSVIAYPSYERGVGQAHGYRWGALIRSPLQIGTDLLGG